MLSVLKLWKIWGNLFEILQLILAAENKIESLVENDQEFPKLHS